MARKQRVKCCNRCSYPAPILYRVQYQENRHWVFVCRLCWDTVQLSFSESPPAPNSGGESLSNETGFGLNTKRIGLCWDSIAPENPFYIYGGTWKADKK